MARDMETYKSNCAVLRIRVRVRGNFRHFGRRRANLYAFILALRALIALWLLHLGILNA